MKSAQALVQATGVFHSTAGHAHEGLNVVRIIGEGCERL